MKRIDKTHKVVNASKKKLMLRNNVDAWILMLPMVLCLYIFIWRSTVMGGFWSFFEMKGFTPGDFCGFDNYRKVIGHSQFFPMLWNNVQFVFWSLIIGYLPPLFIAIMLNEIVHFKSMLRVMVYIPVVIPGIAAMLIWYYLYYPDQTGLLNMILSKVGIAPQKWLNDPDFAIIGIIIYNTWKSFGGAMLLYYAALQGVSPDVYEAALIDGAGPFKRFWNVTRPAIEGLLLLNLVNQIIGVFQIMEQPMAMTGGGPDGATNTLSYQLYNYGFNSAGRSTGQAMALGVIIFLILIVFTIVYFKLNKKVQERY